MTVYCIILLSGGASAMSEMERSDMRAKIEMACIVAAMYADITTSPTMGKLKRIINSYYYSQRPELQDALVYELLFDFEGAPNDLLLRAKGYAKYWGELRNATPVNHRYYKWIESEYRYWSNESERQASEIIDKAK